MSEVTIKRALVSVSNKEHVVSFARILSDSSIEIVSTGGTARLLQQNQIPVIPVETYTGSPEIMDGRVKTLHPKVHGGILFVRDNQNHINQMHEHAIKPIDLVVVNLYPFQQTVAKADATIEEAVENIDIGGPTMIRSAAKNHHFVTVVVDPNDYETVGSELKQSGTVSLQTRKKLAVKAFSHTAEYDQAITQYLQSIYI